MKRNRWGSYEDYAAEVDAEREKKIHDENQDTGNDYCEPWCPYCKEEKEKSDG